MKIRFLFTLALTALFFIPSQAAAERYPFDERNTVIGAVKFDLVDENDSLIEMAKRYDLGYNAITEVNPALDPFVPGQDVDVILPTSWILPDMASYSGIVINISEMRLYFFHSEGKSKVVDTFPIGIGSEGAETPTGRFSVVQKTVNPSWHPPASIRKERPELPLIVPPGPDNPLGTHALRLSLGTILIHGTNRPFAVGRKASHGCIRMYPEDIPELYRMTPNGTRVTIVRQPVKVGARDNKVYIEVHRDEDQNRIDYFTEAGRLLQKKGLMKDVNTEKLYQAVQEKRGMPVMISDEKKRPENHEILPGFSDPSYSHSQ